jgi:hypothetical protein
MGTPVAVFPGAVVTDNQLRVANNGIETQLASPMLSTDTAATVINATGIAGNSIVTIDNEKCAVYSVSGNVLTFGKSGSANLDGRGFDGTAAAPHAADAAVAMNEDAWHHNALKEEVKAIQAALGASLSNIPSGMPQLLMSKYAFTPQTPGGSLSPGSNTIALSPVPPGVNGADSNHYLYISGGTGTAEAVLITGGTAVAGNPSGTLIVTCANSHTGAWTIQSATGGLSEAIAALPSGGGAILCGAGSATLHAPAYNRPIPMWIEGLGQETTTFIVGSDFPLAATGVFNWTSNPGGPTALQPGGMRKFTLLFPQPDSTNVATYTHWPPALYFTSCHRPEFSSINIQCAWTGFFSSSNDGLTAKDITLSFFSRGFDLDGQTDTVRLENIHAWPTGCTANQDTAFTAPSTANVLFWLGNVQDFKITNFGSISGGGPLNAHSGTGGCPVGQLSNCDADTVGEFVVQDGIIEAVNIQMSMVGAVDGFVVNGGLLTITGASVFVNNGVTGTPLKVRINQSATGAAATITPGLQATAVTVIQGSTDINSVQATTATGFTGTAECQLIACRFERSANVSYSSATVSQLSGTGTMRMSVVANKFSDVGSGSVTAILLQDDNNHECIGNSGGGGSFSLAATTKTLWIGNNKFASNVNRFLDPVYLQSGTATATTGAATLNTQAGVVTSEALTTAAGSDYILTLTSSLVTAASQVFASAALGSSTQGIPGVIAVTPGSGSVTIRIRNFHATLAFNGAIKIAFQVNPS